MGVRGGICHLDVQGNQQIELLAWLIVPELGSTNRGTAPHETNVLVIATIMNHDPSLQGQETDPLLRLETVVALVVTRGLLGAENATHA
jgi:hypothetical protein